MKIQSDMVRELDWRTLSPSKDVRKLIEKEGHIFSDFEIATLIFNGLQTYDEKRATLQTLAESTMDMELKAMINKRLAWEENEIPNPFEKGDVVHVVGTDRYGIVLISQTEWEAYKLRMNQVTGKDYILHPLRVMMRMTEPVDKMVAVLHDVLEDTECTEEILRQEGIEEEVIGAINVLTRKEGEEYFSYIKRISKDDRCKRIKQMDLCDNLRDGCSETLKKRYQKALEMLKYED